MSSLAIIAPDGNRVVGLTMAAPLAVLQRAPYGHPQVTREESVDTIGDWPFRFDRICAIYGGRYRSFRPDDLPARFW
jgi:hypothetical protein